VQRKIWCQDRKPHIRETVDKKLGGSLQDPMLRFVPCDKQRALLVACFTKADKGGHPVLIMSYCGCHAAKPMDQQVGGLLHQGPLTLIDAPQRMVEKRPSPFIPMANDCTGQIGKGSRHCDGFLV
jgi:hypothetical protein